MIELGVYILIAAGAFIFNISLLGYCTEVRIASFLSGGFTTMTVINPPEKKLAKRTYVHWSKLLCKRFTLWPSKYSEVSIKRPVLLNDLV